MNRKIVIWGTGKNLQNKKTLLNWSDVVCLVDSNVSKRGNLIEGKQIVLPEELPNYIFDDVVVFASKYYDDIYHILTYELNIPSDKIIYWSDYLNFYNMKQTVEYLMHDIYEKRYSSVYDKAGTFAKYHIYACSYQKEITICTQEKNIFQPPIFRNMYKSDSEQTDVVFLGRMEKIDYVLLQMMTERYRAVYFTSSYSNNDFNQKMSELIEQNGWGCEKSNLNYERMWCISKTAEKGKISIYIATHKEYELPQNDIYTPLWLGKSENNLWGYQEDKDQPEISGLNSLINECTGLYWIWKHARCEYTGLVHYRRYFLNDGKEDINNILDEKTIRNILRSSDIITASLSYFDLPIKEQLQASVEEHAYSQGMQLVERIIAEKQPLYLDAFEYVFSGHTMFPCNMFITSKKIFDSYCEWLFSIIIDAAEAVDVSAYDNYSKRIIGFIAERLFTVWLVKQDLKIKELPMLVTEKITDVNTDYSRIIKGKNGEMNVN